MKDTIVSLLGVGNTTLELTKMQNRDHRTIKNITEDIGKKKKIVLRMPEKI